MKRCSLFLETGLFATCALALCACGEDRESDAPLHEADGAPSVIGGATVPSDTDDEPDESTDSGGLFEFSIPINTRVSQGAFSIDLQTAHALENEDDVTEPYATVVIDYEAHNDGRTAAVPLDSLTKGEDNTAAGIETDGPRSGYFVANDASSVAPGETGSGKLTLKISLKGMGGDAQASQYILKGTLAIGDAQHLEVRVPLSEPSRATTQNDRPFTLDIQGVAPLPGISIAAANGRVVYRDLIYNGGAYGPSIALDVTIAASAGATSNAWPGQSFGVTTPDGKEHWGSCVAPPTAEMILNEPSVSSGNTLSMLCVFPLSSVQSGTHAFVVRRYSVFGQDPFETVSLPFTIPPA